MDPKTTVGQIHLTHPKDANFTSLYEESFSKHGQNIQLFGVLEITGNAGPLARARRQEYEQFMQTLIAAFKKTYITASRLDLNTFEAALSGINLALGKYAARGRVSWIGKVNAVIAALAQNQLSLSVTGKGHVYLLRRKDLSTLSEGLVEEEPAPVKIFANYSSGKVATGDRLLLTTAELLNYVSQDRLRQFMSEDTVAEACQEIMQTVQDVKNSSFAIFVAGLSAAPEADPVTTTPMSPAAMAGARARADQNPILLYAGAFGQSVWRGLLFVGELLMHLVGALLAFIYNFFRRRPKKYLFSAIGAAVIILLIALGSSLWNNFRENRQVETASALSAIEEKLNQAEAALIIDDQNRIVTLMSEVESMLASTRGGTASEREALGVRLQELKNRVNKEVRVDAPTVLTQFSNIPTELYRSPNGILAFNRNSQSFSFYDFRTGQTATVLKNQNTSNLILGEYAGEPFGYAFLTKTGDFQKLTPETDSLASYEGATPSVTAANQKIQALHVLGSGTNARLYLLNQTANQILRVRVSGTAFGPAEDWLKSAADFGSTVDMGVDGNIYVLFPDSADRYFNGAKENFSLSLVSPKLENATKMFVSAETANIYILDPEHNRILVFDKNGKLLNQLLSDKFRELSDISVDEAAGIIYAAAGAELLQIKL